MGASALNLVGKVTCLSAPNLLELCLHTDISAELQTADVLGQPGRSVWPTEGWLSAKCWREVQVCLTRCRPFSCFALQALREMDSSPL